MSNYKAASQPQKPYALGEVPRLEGVVLAGILVSISTLVLAEQSAGTGWISDILSLPTLPGFYVAVLLWGFNIEGRTSQLALYSVVVGVNTLVYSGALYAALTMRRAARLPPKRNPGEAT